MHAAFGFRRQLLVASLALALGAGCGRWQPAKSYQVTTQAEPSQSYATVLDVGAGEKYKVVSKDEASKKVRFQSHINDASFIDVEVTAGKVRLAAAGKLAREDKVHKGLARELSALEGKLKQRLGATTAVAASPPPEPEAEQAAEPASESAAAAASGVPLAWSEPAYDPSVWGNGNFTCLPVKLPVERQSMLSLQLSSGEKADLQLSLAYAPELCRSPAQCKVPGGCPALGIGDPERVNRMAQRLSKGEIAAAAVLFDGAKAVVTIDLTKHGTIAQALTEIKR